MLHETIAKIESRLQGSNGVDPRVRAELVELLGQLKAQVAELAKTHEEEAQSIAGFAEVSALEATRQTRNPLSLQHSLNGLSSSVHDLEETHPKLVSLVNRIATMLANMGI